MNRVLVNPEAAMATIHLVEGPVGAGKSTFAAELASTQSSPRLTLDEWMVTLFSPDRPADGFMQWYLDRKNRCIEQIWSVACDLFETNPNVILELGLVASADRQDFYRRVDTADYELKVYVLEVAKSERRRRVQNRNIQKGATFQMEVSDEIFELADAAWQEPDEIERSERDIQIIKQ